MLYVIPIIILYHFAKSSICIQLCRPDNTGLNKCHDGGCGYNESISTGEKCVCTFSKGIMHGKYCGVYDDNCLENPCKNHGKCKSGIGHHICECIQEFQGVNCEYPVNLSKRIYLYYLKRYIAESITISFKLITHILILFNQTSFNSLLYRSLKFYFTPLL